MVMGSKTFICRNILVGIKIILVDADLMIQKLMNGQPFTDVPIPIMTKHPICSVCFFRNVPLGMLLR